jgi:hypothetical protein
MMRISRVMTQPERHDRKSRECDHFHDLDEYSSQEGRL